LYSLLSNNFLFLSPANKKISSAKYVKNFPGGGKQEKFTRESLRTNARIIDHFLREYSKITTTRRTF